MIFCYWEVGAGARVTYAGADLDGFRVAFAKNACKGHEWVPIINGTPTYTWRLDKGDSVYGVLMEGSSLRSAPK